MAELLHDADALVDVARAFDEPARSWARGLLAIWHPERLVGAPAADLAWDPVLAARPPGLADHLTQALAAGPPTEGLAAAAASLATWGVDLPDPAALATAARGALDGAGSPADPWLALVIAQHGTLDVHALQAAAGSTSSARTWLLAALTIRYAAAHGQARTTATQVMAQLDDAGTVATLVALGAAEDLDAGAREPDLAAQHGATLAGGSVSPPDRKGSRKHRARAWVESLLDGRDDALSAALVAAAHKEHHPAVTARIVAHAAWQATFTPSDDAVSDVVHRGAGHRRDRLDAALAQVTADDLPRLLEGIGRGNVGAAVLGLAVDRQAIAPAILRGALARPTLSWLSAAAACAPHLAASLPESLRHAPQRDVALIVAAWCPTLDVLQALLALPVPHHAVPRRDWAIALASTGDPVAASHVRALASEHEVAGLGHAIALLDGLHL